MGINMYKQDASSNLNTLVSERGLNSITHAANGLLAGIEDDKLKERRIEYFYDQMLMDTIKLGSENNVFLKYCKVKTVPNGNEKFLLRRWGGLTEHTTPLAEGEIPKSDHMASESFEGTYAQYGRYMEFTDRVEFNLIDDVIAHYSIELGDTAVRMAERLCREELIANAGESYPEGKTFKDLVIGDTVGIADYRLAALKFARRLVKPLNGCYVVICSPEHIYDLVDDELVKQYMEYTHTAEPFKTGKPVELFNIRFEETQLDDFAYGYTEISHPGEFQYMDSGTEKNAVRLVFVKADGTLLYGNFKAGTATTTLGASNGAITSGFSGLVIKRTEEGNYIKDGSYIPNLVKYDLDGLKAQINAATSTNKVSLTNKDGGMVEINSANQIVNVYELPVHRSFMFGDEFIYKTGIDGRMNAQFFVKEKGSAGVLDPINQRQSVGFKIDTLGFNTVRPEAMVQFIFVPKHALETYDAVLDELNKHYN